MLFNTTDPANNGATIHHENDEQIISLEAFQGDSALIETVNELHQLKAADHTLS